MHSALLHSPKFWDIPVYKLCDSDFDIWLKLVYDTRALEHKFC